MRSRIRRLKWRIWMLGGVDIVVTHAPPQDLGDDDDPAHWGFAALREFLDRYHPRYLIHGHVHMSYGHNIPREIEYNGTTVINAYERYVVEIPEGTYPAKHYNQLIWKTPQNNPTSRE